MRCVDLPTGCPDTAAILSGNTTKGATQWPGIVSLPCLPTSHGEIDLWLIHLANRPRCHGLDWLSATERARAARFAFDRDRDRYRTAHVAMRELLARYGGPPPGVLDFLDGKFGKPYLASPYFAPRFNLSHSDDLALFGISQILEIGVDIERIHQQKDIEQLAEQAFTKRELSEFAALPRHDRLHAFFRGWTRKEACLKAIGRGLSVPMTGFEAGFDSNRKTTRLMVDSDRFDVVVQSIAVGNDAEAAVAWLAPPPLASRN